jgi:thermitase
MTDALPLVESDKEPEWALEICSVIDAWKVPPKPGGKSMGEGIIVIHPDTGWTTHPELWDTSRIVDGRLADDRYLTQKSRNFIDPGEIAIDKLEDKFDPVVIERKGAAKWIAEPQIYMRNAWSPSHGTVTASVILSMRGQPDSNEFPEYPVGPGFVSGIAPKVIVIPYKVTKFVVLDAQAAIDLAAAIQYAVNLSKASTDPEIDGAKIGVISISMGTPDSKAIRKPLASALAAARQVGIVVIAAAGQLTEGIGKIIGVTYPGTDPNTICAAGCNFRREKYKDGFYGSAVDITAPAVNVWVARAIKARNVNEGFFSEQSKGTSFATAIVAGACALWQAHHGRANLIKEYGRELIFDLFKKVLKDSCDTPPGWDTANRGAGVLNAKRLLEHPLPPRPEIEKIRGG